MKTADGALSPVFCALFLCISFLITIPVTAQIDDLIENAVIQGFDAWERLDTAGRCHSTVGTVWLTTYLDGGVLNPNTDLGGQPSGNIMKGGPELLPRKDMTNWANNNGDWCDGKDPLPYPMPANSSTSWIIGEKDGGWFAPELYLYFQVVDPQGNPTPCFLSLFEDSTSNHVTITLSKSADCDAVPEINNSLKILQSGIYCSKVVDSMHGKLERFTKVGNTEGDCPASNRIPGTGNYENKSVFYSSFSVYWDPVPGSGATAEGASAIGNTTLGPAAAPEMEATSSATKVSFISSLVMGLTGLLVLIIN